MASFQSFIKKYIEEFLIGLAIVLLLILVSYFIWGIMDVSQQINQAIGSGATAGVPMEFNLKSATDLNLKGLLQH
jgi:CHASE3 domain sensor protein